jgi:hypothetical protein
LSISSSVYIQRRAGDPRRVLIKSFAFEASHLLPLHDGKCNRLHGLGWRCSLIVEGDRLIADGPKASHSSSSSS